MSTRLTCLTNLTVDLYSGYFMTPNGNFTNGDMGENRGHSGGLWITSKSR